MTLKEYKITNNLSNRELTNELRSIQPELDEPMVSRIVSGVVRPSEKVEEYINTKSFEKVFANDFDGLLDGESINIPVNDKTVIESPFLQDLYIEISKGTMDRPATRGQLKHHFRTGDRVVRRGIEELRNAGVKVVSHSDKHGYWLNDGYDAFRSQMLKKAYTIIRTIKAMDSRLEGQFEWADTQRS